MMLKAIATFGFVSALAAGVFWGPLLFAIAVVLTLIFVGFIFLRQYAQVSVSEMDVAVVMTDGGRRFSRFLPAGTHFINPLSEFVADTISTTGQSVRGKTERIQTAGGLPVAVNWAVKFSIHPSRIKQSKAAKLARTISTKAGKMVNDHVHHILHHVLEQYTIEALCQPGIHEKIERAVRQQLLARLTESGFKFSRIMVETIDKPAQVISALEAAHERQIQAELEAKTLSRLQQVISQFSDEDMRRLVELERIHAMGRNGVAMMYPAASDLYSSPSQPRHRVILDPFSN